MSARTPGYNDLDLMARQSAMQTLVLVLIAKKVGVSEDPTMSAWIEVAEDNAPIYSDPPRAAGQRARRRRTALNPAEERMPFELMSECCDQCLMSDKLIVSAARRRQIVKDTMRKDCAFICHKATIAGREIACRGHFDATGGGQVARIAGRFGAIREIDWRTLQPVTTCYATVKKWLSDTGLGRQT